MTTTFALLGWIETALIIFFLVFVLIVIGVLLRKRGHYDGASRIPLEDDPVEPRASNQEPAP